MRDVPTEVPNKRSAKEFWLHYVITGFEPAVYQEGKKNFTLYMRTLSGPGINSDLESRASHISLWMTHSSHCGISVG